MGVGIAKKCESLRVAMGDFGSFRGFFGELEVLEGCLIRSGFCTGRTAKKLMSIFSVLAIFRVLQNMILSRAGVK